MNLVLLTFGERLENHYQACFSILSFLKDPNIKNVIIVTDRADFYQFLNGQVKFIHINQQTIKEWQGKYQFFWRIKIKALEIVQQHYPEQNLLYIDSDTFLASNLDKMYIALNQGQTFMHKAEYTLGSQANNTIKKMYQSLNGQTFANIPLNEHSMMWNAGVIALPANKAKEIIQLTLQLCDEICATNCTRRLVKQFSFSIALNHQVQLQACDNLIGHYWSNKEEWNEMIAKFFVNGYLQNMSLEEAINQLRDFDWNCLPIHKKQRNTKTRLIKLIDHLFPAKNIQYFSK
ncbi:hypothetical protein [Pasteurella bettyae]|uniref:Glycosyltransferase family 8 n=1 Tax=Pasteurella bettyae CCUG 2042 TaxID=1095749 RepID=I3DJE1_9PAST|nr:hypothetical protein [Pasteurella bettyae]EIJ71834.1 hypothetical protein HMPREF1052_1025 [Pasteurella bettyae CCUG 2042]SUB22332.1 Uncharacterised protein [Pasteurella bettyae]